MIPPITLKQQLLALAQCLNPACRGGFVRRVVRRLDTLALTYPRTVVYGVAGFFLGQVVDALVGIPAWIPGTVAGALFGLHRDLEADEMERQVRLVIAEELSRHTDA